MLGRNWGLERAGRRQIKTKACSEEAKSLQPQEPDPQGRLKAAWGPTHNNLASGAEVRGGVLLSPQKDTQ